MKKLGTLILFIGLFFSVKGQQLPLFSQYYFNSFIYNPSHTGQTDGTTATLIARKQFTGLANSIGTYAATLQTRSLDKRAGFGFYFYNDNVNLFRTNALSGSYAYHVPLSNERTLSFGLALSALDHRYNANNFHLINEGDPLLALLGSEGGFTFDGSFGVNMDFGKFQMGLANLQLLQNQEAFKDNSNNKVLYTLANHWMFNASYTIDINEDLELEPYLLYRKVKNAPGQADVNIFLNWKEKGYAGIAYRDGMSFSTMLGVQVSNAITVGYAFDLTTHKLRTALGNTHEVVLKFDLGKTKSAGKDEVLAQKDREAYEQKINALNTEVNTLKTLPPDTVVIEKTIIKEVIKEVPVEVIKVVKEAPKVETPKAEIPAKPKETPKEVPKETPTSTTQFYIIAGSFANSNAAQDYIKTLKAKGYTGYEHFDAKSGRTYVHMGNFTDKNKAVAVVASLKSSGLPLWIKSM